jgi:hypothetical protein
MYTLGRKISVVDIIPAAKNATDDMISIVLLSRSINETNGSTMTDINAIYEILEAIGLLSLIADGASLVALHMLAPYSNSTASRAYSVISN